MGYDTSYSLTWNKGDALYDIPISDLIEDGTEELRYALTRDGSTNNGDARWYDHEADMKLFSRKFPGILFTLSGEGEESGDIWKKYFRDGKMQIAKAVIDFPEFSARLLK